MHEPTSYLLKIVAWVVAEALLSLFTSGAFGLFFIPLVHSPSLSLTVNKGASKSGTISSISSGSRKEALS